jgi:YD repeat-containing protein
MLSDGTLSFTYDAAHRLASVSSNDAVLATFAYDAQGRRVRKVTPTATHLYFYDARNLVRETLVTRH